MVLESGGHLNPMVASVAFFAIRRPIVGPMAI